MASSPKEVSTYAGCTLLAASMIQQQEQAADTIQWQDGPVHACIAFLQDNEFISLRKTTQPGNYANTTCP